MNVLSRGQILIESFVFRVIAEKPKEVLYTHQRKYIQCSGQESTEPGYVNIKELAEAMCRYDLDDMDLHWLNTLNRELERMGEERDHGGIIHHEIHIVLLLIVKSVSTNMDICLPKLEKRALRFGLILSQPPSGVSLTMWAFSLVCLPGEEPVHELTMERAMEALERQCHDNMNHAIETVEGLGIEYDEDVICDVCRSPDSEEGNDMVFCDKCNICVHQVNTPLIILYYIILILML